MARTHVRRADEHLRWLRAITGKASFRPEGPGGLPPLAALTGCDYRALEAIDRLWTLHGYCDHPKRVIRAVALTALEMQDSTRPLARELIAHAKDWGDRERLWPLVEAEMELLRGAS
jgi:hypothetical protein